MLKWLVRIEFAAACMLLAAIVALVFVAAIMRFFDHPLIWSVDLAQLLFIWLCFFGAARAMREKSHIGIDLIVRALGHRNRLILETLLTALILAFLAALTIEGVRLTVMNSQRQFGDSGISYAWVTFAVPAGCVMLGAALIYNLIGAWRRRGDGRTLVYSRSEGDAPSVTEL